MHYDLSDIPKLVNPRGKEGDMINNYFVIYKQLSSDLWRSNALFLKLSI